MYNIQQARTSTKYTRNYILSHVDELDLFYRYAGKFKLKQAYNSPLRKDNNPSFTIFPSKSGGIMYHDHTTNDSGDVFKFLKQLWNCSLKDVYKRIVDDLPATSVALQSTTKAKYTATEVQIGIKRKMLTDIDVHYWYGKYNIPKETLYKFKVYPISYYVSNGVQQALYTNADPMYAYKVDDRFRIYRPLTKNKANKWRGNLQKNNVFGYEQLPKSGNLLIITKSLKDVMVLYELGYIAVAPASESTEIPECIVNELRTRFKRVVVFFDNDAAGIKHSTKLATTYSLERIQIDPQSTDSVKDVSDYVEIHGKEKTFNYLESLLDGNT